MAVARTLLHDLDDFPLAQQHVAQRYFARTVCIPDVATSLREVFEVRARKALAARPAQRLLPNLTFEHDGVTVEQVFLCPLNRFADGNALFRLYDLCAGICDLP